MERRLGKHDPRPPGASMGNGKFRITDIENQLYNPATVV